MTAAAAEATRAPTAAARFLGKALPEPRKRKLGELVAERMQAAIATIGWPVGQVLGNEPQLLQTYGVSRATLREAIRQLERHGVATMRRGFGGGLVVQAPARMAAVRALATYFELTDISLDELFEARAVLETMAIELAIKRLSDADIEALRRDIQLLESTADMREEVRLHWSLRRTIAAATHNPALVLFLESLNRVTGALMPDYERLARMRKERQLLREAKRQFVDAVISGNVFAAEQAARVELNYSYEGAVRNLKRFKREMGEVGAKADLISGSAPQVADWDANQKLPHRLAVAMARFIAHGKQPPGTRVGSEPEFVARFGVSRAVFREAVRMLEGYGIVRMRRGFLGGLVVGAPDPTLTVSLVTGYLSYAKLSLTHFFEVLQTLELLIAPRAAARAPQADIAALQDYATELASQDRYTMLEGIETISFELQRHLGNRALELIGRVINAYKPHYALKLPPMRLCRALLKVQQEILAAVAIKDEGLARRKATQLLKAVDLWWGSKSREDWLKRL